MITSRLRLITTKVSILDLANSQPFDLSSCGLRWKQNRLWVKALDDASAVRLPAVTHSIWLQDCLRHSRIEAVCLDSSISQLDLERWLIACTETNKPVFLRLSSRSIFCRSVFPERQSPIDWRLKRLADWCGALLLLIGLSPLWLALALWILTHSSKPVLDSQWRVGRRGKLFQMLKFRVPPSGFWIQRSYLEHMPQLLNVLAGEMSLVGPRPWKPADALRHPDQPCLNALPGITGVWPLKRRSSGKFQLHSLDRDYLRHWSLGQDLRLLTTAIRVLGAVALS
jgi:lipopolysaccharide/colanic/teichoic acid biosynthesis glycosyltransferase